MRIGPVIISIGTTLDQWGQDVSIVRAMKPDLLKVPIETMFTPYPHRIRALADEFKPKLMVLSLGMEAITGGWTAAEQLIGQQMETIDAHPEIEFCLEVGNEPEYHEVNGVKIPWAGMPNKQWDYRYRVLDLAKRIRSLNRPNLKVGASMPVYLDHARDVVLSRDEHGCIAEDIDYLCSHYYGFEFIGDGAGNGKDHNAAWGPIYAMLRETAKPILFTEIGIDSPSSTIETKSRRLLDWLERQPSQVVGAAIWCVGPWKNMGLDLPGAQVYGARREQPTTTPPTKEQPVSKDRPMHVAISYGHNNRDGGHPFEAQQTPQLGKAVADACHELGMEVRIIQEECDTRGMGLQDVAGVVVNWHRSGWPVDLYLETHTEGGGPNARGVFAIYPDTGGDVDHDAKRVGQDAAKRIAEAVNIPLRKDGIMSERLTGVGSQGYRLGIFLVTAAIKGDTTRMIIEYGSHDNQADINAIMGNLAAVGMATAQAFAAEARRLGFPVNDAPDRAEYQAVKSNDHRDMPTGIALSYGFKTLYEEAERAPNQLGIRLLGVGPICEPFDMAFGDNPGQLYTVQLLERGGGFLYEAGAPEPWKNHGLTTWQVIEAWRYGIKHNKIPEQFIPEHLR